MNIKLQLKRLISDYKLTKNKTEILFNEVLKEYFEKSNDDQYSLFKYINK